MKVQSIRLGRPLNKTLKMKIEPYSFEVGILRDLAHKAARDKKKGLKNYAGGPARKIGSKSYSTLSEVSSRVRKATKINYLVLPWKKKNDDALKLLRGFWKLVFNDGKIAQRKRVANLVQAVVRNPILRKTYGRNKKVTENAKGFNRKFIDTAQLFKNIKAKVKINLVRGAR